MTPAGVEVARNTNDVILEHPADEQRQTLEASLGEFGARSVRQSLKSSYQEKQTGVITSKKDLNELLKKILEDKKTGNRSKPSKKLILGASKFTDQLRKDLVDIVGEIVDQNWCGRSEMCVLFAILLGDALRELSTNPQVVIGKGTYTDSKNPSNTFTWDHAWVLVGDEIIDGNVDSIIENPAVPEGIEPKNFWGPFSSLPSDRTLLKDKEINEDWIKENTSYEELHKWRSQLNQELKGLRIK